MSVWFITGASRGLGAAIANEALSRGHQVVATARNIDDLHAAFPAAGDAVLPLAVDVTNEQQLKDAAAAAVAHFGRIDVLVNNAGLLRCASPRAFGATRFALIFSRPPTLLRVLAVARPLRELNALSRTRFALDASRPFGRSAGVGPASGGCGAGTGRGSGGVCLNELSLVR